MEYYVNKRHDVVSVIYNGRISKLPPPMDGLSSCSRMGRHDDLRYILRRV